MNENEKSELVLSAIEKMTSGALEKKEGGIDLLAIVKKVSRNRRKGQSLE